MKKFFKEIIIMIVAMFIIANVINILRAPKLDIKTDKFFSKDIQIVYFYTNWCKICKLENPQIKNLNKSLKVLKIDAEDKSLLTKIFKVKAYPTIFYIKNNKVIYTDIGFTSALAIRVKYLLLNLIY